MTSTGRVTNVALPRASTVPEAQPPIVPAASNSAAALNRAAPVVFARSTASRPSDATLRETIAWSAAPAAHRAWVTHGLDRLGTTLAAWLRDTRWNEPLFPDEVFSVIAGGFDLGLTYDVDALAVVHRCRDLITPPDGHPLARTLLAGLRTPGSKLRRSGDGIELIPPTADTLADFDRRMQASRGGRVARDATLPGVKPENVWYDGVAPLDIEALAGKVSAARRNVVARATAMVSHRWQASPRNTHHGLAADGVWTDTPDASFIDGGFMRKGENVGLPYFWGGFSDVASFDRGIAHGLPAGHIFAITPTFRQDNPFTPLGLGVDCSGFCAQAWNLDRKIATGEIAERTTPLEHYAQLQPGDVVMKVWQHVMLFVGRRGDALLFMESTPPRCIGQSFTADQLKAMEMLPRAATWLDRES